MYSNATLEEHLVGAAINPNIVRVQPFSDLITVT